MKKYKLKILCALCLLPALLTGCWHTGSETADPERLPVEDEAEITPEPVTLPAEFSLPYAAQQTLDPLTCPDGIQQTVGALLYEGLFALDTKWEPQKVLCDTYSYDPAAFTYVFTLRSGVAFSDGSPLTAADVASTLKRAKTTPRYGSRLSQVKTVSAAGGTVIVVLTGANSAFPALLDIPIVKSGTESRLLPTGTGPYRYEAGEPPYLVANESWWGGGGRPVERIRLVDTPDRDRTLYHFSSHDVQLITADLTGTEPVSVTGDIHFQDANTTILQYVGFNTRRPPFNSPTLRQAVALGVNRGTVISGFLLGHGTAAQFPLSPLSPLYPAKLDSVYSYNTFQTAMTAAGYNKGSSHSVTLLVNSENSFKVAAAGYIASSLSAFDLKVTVRALPWAEYSAALAAGNFDLYYGESRLSADWNLTRLVGTGGSLNYGGYTDPLTDQLLASYAAATDSAAAMAQLCTRLKVQMPLLPICFKTTSVLSQSEVLVGLNPTAANPFYGLSSLSVMLDSK
ncbi:MAG: ABC transporter substrate-binding protein [Oscillibacter sp.]